MAYPVISQIPNLFYVYEIVVDGQPRYIGKGCGERFKEHLRTAKRISRRRKAGQKFRTSRFYNRLVRALNAGLVIEARLVADGLDEPSALALEIQQISSRPRGLLWNTFSGGQGFTSDWLRSMWQDPSYREARSAKSRDMWKDPAYRENQISQRRSPEHRARSSIALKQALSDPTVRKKMRDRKLERYSDPAGKREFVQRMQAGRDAPARKARVSEAQKRVWADPGYKARMSEIHRKSRANPEIKSRMSVATSLTMTPERRAAISEAMKAKWLDPAYRANQSQKRSKG